MIEDIFLTQVGIVNAAWENCAVYFVGIPTKGDIYYVGQARNLVNRTGYTADVENYKCVNSNTGRFPLVVFTDTVEGVLKSSGHLTISSKYKLLDVIEDGGIVLFDTMGRGNKVRKHIAPLDTMFGAAIIILSRKYNIIDSIKKASLLYGHICENGRKAKLSKGDTKEIAKLKEEYNNISNKFFNSIKKGNIYVQQGIDRECCSFNYHGSIYSKDNIDIISGDYGDLCTIMSDKSNVYIDSVNDCVYIFSNTKYNKSIIFLTKNFTKRGDIVLDKELIRNLCQKNNILSSNIVNIIDKNINFVPII